ncbi:GntR family transcriptional regulator [Glutamicibacter endophyticus]|uniref:GntR family transcriptional regulator n=1 Tax=Glutamicibacter endophyticus TaxID=1522174 RepID=UPI003AEF2CD0
MQEITQWPWATQVESRPGVPLRVAAYSRIAEAIRAGQLSPGALLPTESQLGTLLHVSRTVVREALMLLEEDGLVRARRGVGRFVSHELPRIGIEKIQPYERLLAAPNQQLELRRTSVSEQPASEFIAPRLGLEIDAPTHLFETVFLRDGEPVALLQEHVAVSDEQIGQLARELSDQPATESTGTLLTRLQERLGSDFGPGECEISVSQARETRAPLLELEVEDPILVLTQSVAFASVPRYVAKCVVPARAGHLLLKQT